MYELLKLFINKGKHGLETLIFSKIVRIGFSTGADSLRKSAIVSHSKIYNHKRSLV